MKINLNDYIIVRLSASGEETWKMYWDRTARLHGEEGVPSCIRENATLPDGRVQFHLWQAMQIFGPDCFNGSIRLPFVDNVIEVCG